MQMQKQQWGDHTIGEAGRLSLGPSPYIPFPRCRPYWQWYDDSVDEWRKLNNDTEVTHMQRFMIRRDFGNKVLVDTSAFLSCLFALLLQITIVSLSVCDFASCPPRSHSQR